MLTRAGRTRRRPRLRTILLAVNLAILALPLGGVTALRLYESALVRQTESELLGQGAILAAAYRAALARTRAGRGATGDYGVPADPEWLPAEGRWHPRPAALDLAVDAVRPRPPHAKESAVPPDSAAATAGADIASIMQEAQASTLAGIRVVDFRGVVVASTAEEVGRSLGDREEVARALQGEAVSLLRERVSSEAGLVSISRAAKLRVFVALPVLDGWRVAGAVVLSRTPRSIGETLYAKRFHLLAGAGLLLVVVFLTALFTSLTVSRPVEAVVRQSERAARGERGAVAPLERPITRRSHGSPRRSPPWRAHSRSAPTTSAPSPRRSPTSSRRRSPRSRERSSCCTITPTPCLPPSAACSSRTWRPTRNASNASSAGCSSSPGPTWPRSVTSAPTSPRCWRRPSPASARWAWRSRSSSIRGSPARR